jgi:hypothetical protein
MVQAPATGLPGSGQLRGNDRIDFAFPGFGNRAEQRNQSLADSFAAQFAGAAAIGTAHDVIQVSVAVPGKHGNNHVELCGVLDVAGRVVRRFGKRLADPPLQFIGVNFRLACR